MLRSAGRIGVYLGVIALGCGPTPSTPAPPAQHPEPAAPATAPQPPAPAPAPVLPVVTPEAAAAHSLVQTRLLGGPLPPSDLVHTTAIVDPGGHALDGFHGALRRLAAGDDPDGKVRVAVYGSSSVAVDRYTGYLRGYLQARFGDGGIGFVAAVPLWKWHRHNEVSLTAGRGWQVEHVQKKNLRAGGHAGLLGAVAVGSRKKLTASIGQGGREWFSPLAKNTRVELHYLRQPGGGRFTAAIGTRRPVTVATRAEAIADGVIALAGGGEGPLHVRLLGDGEVRLLGALFERPEPGVVLDALGIGGTRAANMLVWDEPMWTAAVRERAPDLYVLAYGANESVDEDEPLETYRANLEVVLARFAATLPTASCLLVGPVDFPVQDPTTKQWGPRARLAAIIDTQRELAAAHGCGFFDTRAFMGGAGSMDAWVVAQLAKADHLHFSKLGYLHLGRMLADALMAGYDAGA